MMSDYTFRITFDLFQYINANDADSILELISIITCDGDEIKFGELDANNEKRNATVTDSNENSVTRNEKRNALSNAERQKRYRERNGKRNDRNEKNVTRNENSNEKESNKENILINNTLNNTNNSLNSIEITEKNLKNNSENCNEIEDKELINMPSNEKNVTRNEISVTKNRYGSQKNVLLSQIEYAKLCEKLNDADEKIEAASLYFASKGNASKYKSHYATILNWDRMAKERDAEKQTFQKPQETSFGDIRNYFEAVETPQWDIDL